jgi:hypothetical protein
MRVVFYRYEPHGVDVPMPRYHRIGLKKPSDMGMKLGINSTLQCIKRLSTTIEVYA